MENDIEKLKIQIEVLQAEVVFLNARINKEQGYRLQDSKRLMELAEDLSRMAEGLTRRLSHIDKVIILALGAFIIHCASHILKWWGM
jgi:hypothetical protein